MNIRVVVTNNFPIILLCFFTSCNFQKDKNPSNIDIILEEVFSNYSSENENTLPQLYFNLTFTNNSKHNIFINLDNINDSTMIIIEVEFDCKNEQIKMPIRCASNPKIFLLKGKKKTKTFYMNFLNVERLYKNCDDRNELKRFIIDKTQQITFFYKNNSISNETFKKDYRIVNLLEQKLERKKLNTPNF